MTVLATNPRGKIEGMDFKWHAPWRSRVGVSLWKWSVKDNHSHGADGIIGGKAADGVEKADGEDGRVMTRVCFWKDFNSAQYFLRNLMVFEMIERQLYCIASHALAIDIKYIENPILIIVRI